jgi:putative phosphoesterase
LLVGVVSDTHGYLNPKVPVLLRGVDHILHAGDIGGNGILEELGRIAPVTAVRGNVDREGPASLYPLDATEVFAGCTVFLTHQVKVPKGLDDPAMEGYHMGGFDVVVFGHSHIALQERRGRTLFFNPGAAGKRRFKAVPSIGFLTLEGGLAEGIIIPL